MVHGSWLAQPRKIEIFVKPRILVREITSPYPRCLNAVLVLKPFLNNKSVLNILHPSNNLSELKFLLGLLNSKIISFFYKQVAVKSTRNIFPKVVVKNLREFPFPVDFRKAQHDQMVKLVEQILILHQQLNDATSNRKKETIQRQINRTDKKIDQRVYELYDLTPDDIAIVEEASQRIRHHTNSTD